MRARFIVQILAEDKSQPQPDNLCDFIIDWDKPVPVIAIKFCPFCGVKIDVSKEPLRTKNQ